MKAPIRAVPLAFVLSLIVTAPVFADAPVSTHVSIPYECQTIEATGFTFCSATESEIWTKERKSGGTSLKVDTWFLSTAQDPAGNVSSLESTSRERDLVVVQNGGPVFVDQNLRREDEITESGVTTCTRYRILVKHGIERISDVTTTPGPC